jgi:hypothetical protein
MVVKREKSIGMEVDESLETHSEKPSKVDMQIKVETHRRDVSLRLPASLRETYVGAIFPRSLPAGT